MKNRKRIAKIRPYIMIAPALAGILLFTVYPVIKLVQLSLMNTNMLNPSKSKFIGLDNFKKVGNITLNSHVGIAWRIYLQAKMLY